MFAIIGGVTALLLLIGTLCCCYHRKKRNNAIIITHIVEKEEEKKKEKKSSFRVLHLKKSDDDFSNSPAANYNDKDPREKLVLKSYIARGYDELSIKKGNTVLVLETFPDGWARVFFKKENISGMFPIGCLENGENEMESNSNYYWSEWFLSLKGNEFFCEVDDEYILDRFNLTGLNTEVENYSLAYDVITDSLENEIEDEKLRMEVEKNREFGKCPRILCNGQNVLPIGVSDQSGLMSVKLYCPHCEDIYIPNSKRHQSTDGAYFGTSFPHLLLQVHNEFLPKKNNQVYSPKIFGFKVHHIANEQRKQDLLKIQNQEKVEKLIETFERE
ncbi:casein kinase 2 regulatory subunit [Clydaea vesicula]|uniref:Casein kinase II subunit beta n=1 Tax=Clydaea vesicula TaxID=447962 RepID=A0AAD5TXM3_9FUNG|nr:casein kinase 2 regulatory subunit [Clydaea vesicula]